MANMIFKGRAWVLRDDKKEMIPSIDTDMIYHNAHLAVTDVSEMGQYSFGNLEGYEDFPSKVQKTDIIVAGINFGAGSSRQHAVDCFRALGVTCLVVESAGAIYKRNAINSGFPLMIVDGLSDIAEDHEAYIETGDIIEVNCQEGVIKNITKDSMVPNVRKMSSVQYDIFEEGNLFEYGKKV